MEAEQLPSPPVAEPTRAEFPKEVKVSRAKERVEARKGALEEERREQQMLEHQMIPA